MKVFELVCLSTGSEVRSILLETDNDEMTDIQFQELCKKVNEELGGRAPIKDIANSLITEHGFKDHKEKVDGRYTVM